MDALRIDGRPCKLVRNQEAYAAAEAREGMIAWNGNAENMIDRFDGRALLDFYKDPDPRNKPQKADEELELEEVTCSLLSLLKKTPHFADVLYTTPANLFGIGGDLLQLMLMSVEEERRMVIATI